MKTIALAIVVALASTAAPAAPPPSPPVRGDCSAPESRQLDFWLGEWDVSNSADGQAVGESRIDKLLGGCGLRETYQSPHAPGGAYAGTSYSGWNRRDRQWHQMYIDSNGNVTWYSGGLEGGDMVFRARTGALQRMAYRLQADGSVRQIGTISTDDGASWQPGYDYTYRHKPH